MLHAFDLMFRTTLLVLLPFVLTALIYMVLDFFKRTPEPTINDIIKQIEEDKANA